MHFGGHIPGTYSSFFAQRLGAIQGSVFIDLFLVIGFAAGIALIGKVSEIHLQITGFFSMVVGLALIAAGAASGNNMPLIISGFVVFNIMLNAGPNLTTFTLPSAVFPVRFCALVPGWPPLAASSAQL